MREPNVACYGVLCEYQRTRGRTIENVDECWVAATVRCQVIGGKRDTAGSEVIVNCKICKAFLGAFADTASHELRSQPTVAANARHVVNAILGQEQATSDQSETSFGSKDRCPDDGAVLVAIVAEQMRLQVIHDRGRQPQTDRLCYCACSHVITLATLRAAVSSAGSRRLLRRDSCSADSPWNEPTAMPGP